MAIQLALLMTANESRLARDEDKDIFRVTSINAVLILASHHSGICHWTFGCGDAFLLMVLWSASQFVIYSRPAGAVSTSDCGEVSAAFAAFG